MPKTVAVVEEEEALAEVLQRDLEREGFDVEVYGRGDDAWEGIQSSPPDAIVLDLSLPGLDGPEVTRRVRGDGRLTSVPIVMLATKADGVDGEERSELGADEYVIRPFSAREVVLRVKAMLRRAGSSKPGPKWLEAGPIRMDPEARRAEIGGNLVYLTPTEFNLLHVLLERAGHAQSRGRLLSEVWGYADDVDSRTVDTHIRRLRKKLGTESTRIQTVIGVGYKLRL